MLELVHQLIVAVYVVLPMAVLGRAIVMSMRRKNRVRIHRFWITGFIGIVMAIAVCAVSAFAQHGRVRVGQVLLASYFATSLLLILKGFDQLLLIGVRYLLRLRSASGPGWWYGMRSGMALLARAVLLFGVGLPYVLAAATTYRPKVEAIGDPMTLYRWPFEAVNFSATDGVRIAGWWIPATSGLGNQTVLLCPGLGGNKASQLMLARRLVPGGYNVLVIDFRDTGESAGQLLSFGDLERRDVLGAVRWLIAEHPKECERLSGLGASTGAAALVSAAADPSVEGQRIDALAVYGAFDRLDSVADGFLEEYVPPPMGWCMEHIGMPLASLQVGADLRDFSPAESAKKLWPRPLLVVHGLDDEMVDFENGQALYDAALQPKYCEWVEHGRHEDVMSRDSIARMVKRYFDSAGRWL